jgi:hypothetical protein
MRINKINKIYTAIKKRKEVLLFLNSITVQSFIVKGLFITTLILSSCKKMISISKPVNSITTEGTFSTDATATSAVSGIYSKLINAGGPSFGNGATTIYCGLSADELTKAGIDGPLLQLYTNNILSDNPVILAQIWGPAYFTVYQANSCIDGLQNSKTINSSLKTQLTSECKFLRAFSYFYLTNFWGDIPMPLSSNWNQTNKLSRTDKNKVYDQIIADLKDAQNELGADYSIGNNEKIRANKWAATALLARVYLYKKEWADAENEATAVINSGIFALDSNLNDVFLKNSSEAILQLQPNSNEFPFAVQEQFMISNAPIYYLRDNLIAEFEQLDKRKDAWTKSDSTYGTPVFYPYKYKINYGSPGNITEYYMVLRLAEQYLIRAEARAHQNKLPESQDDINIIRTRAGLPSVSLNNQSLLLLAIEHERQIELFSEWGHRWFDLIRTERANEVLSNLKVGAWQSTDQLYPIPISEIRRNSTLKQNPGYN